VRDGALFVVFAKTTRNNPFSKFDLQAALQSWPRCPCIGIGDGRTGIQSSWTDGTPSPDTDEAYEKERDGGYGGARRVALVYLIQRAA
jgi:hypothetical protein